MSDNFEQFFLQQLMQNQKKEYHTSLAKSFTDMPMKEVLAQQDKDEIYQRQINVRQRSIMCNSEPNLVNFNNTSVDSISQKNICKKPLTELKKIYLRDCKVNKVMENCVIYAKQFTYACQVIAANFGVEDEKGDFITLTFYNTFKTQTSLQVLDKNFPIGQCIAIKNPYLKYTSSGTFVLRNDNPTNLEIIPTMQKSIKEAQIKQNSIESSKILKDSGNKKYENGEYIEAIQLYEQALSQLQQSNDEKEIDQLSIILFSNISQCHLNISKFQIALNFAEKALKIDQNHLKSLGRKAKSLKMLYDFKKCLEVYQILSQHLNVEKEINDLKQLINKQENGFKIEDFILTKLNKEDQLSFFSYQGPIKICQSEKKGRGIFVTRDVKQGEILIIDETLAEPFKENQKNEIIFGLNNDKTFDMHSQVQFKTYLLQQAIDNVSLRKRLSYLYKGENIDNLRIPDLSIYKYNYYNDEDEQIILSVEEIYQIIKFNSTNFKHEQFQDDSLLNDYTILNPLISLINHNRDQNVKLVGNQNYTLVVTLRDIKKDEELFYDYLNNSGLSKQERKSQLLHWNIVES